MIKFDFDNNCTGCKACASVCPVNAIKFVSGRDSFWYPQVDEKLCIECDKCNKVCPYETSVNKDFSDVKTEAWLYNSKNDDAKMYSSSGAAFYDLASFILDEEGSVLGCKWDEKLQAVHGSANNLKELRALQGSKYVQSNTEYIYKEAVSYLHEGKKVLFSGLPCQCVAMKNYVESECKEFRSNLITVGLICHGVPSPMVWESYKKWLENNYQSKLVYINFRDKTKEGYKKQYCRHEFENGDILYTPSFLPTSKFMESSIVYNLDIRRSCSRCVSKRNYGKIDIILGDWYSEYTGKGKLGTSCICAYSDAGAKFVKKALKNIREFDYCAIKAKNRYIEESVKLSKNRDLLLSNIDNIKWEKIEKYYPWKYRIKKILFQLGIYEMIKGKK